MSFRSKIQAYADANWLVPCADGLVWTYYTSINCPAEIARRTKNPAEWRAAFLLYDGQKHGQQWKLEGLLLIKASSASSVIARNFEATSFPERIMISSWFDHAGDDKLTVKPPFHGLNDCAHFATECLAAGGINVRTTGVPTLLGRLRAMADTKTLALTVNKTLADRIVKAGIMDVGDVIIFSLTPGDHHHSTIYMGGGKIAMHTWANHPSSPVWQGNWIDSASDDHPLVTLIHFGRDDVHGASAGSLEGWWNVSWRGMDYYYLFDRKGHVSYTQTKPLGASSPLSSPTQRGYWFDKSGKIMVCWPKTGTLEEYRFAGGTSQLMGNWNGADLLQGSRVF